MQYLDPRIQWVHARRLCKLQVQEKKAGKKIWYRRIAAPCLTQHYSYIRVVNLSQNAVQIKNSQNHASCKNYQINQSVHSIFDYPKMPWFSKKANLVKDLDAVVKSHTIKAYLHFDQGRRGLLLDQHHIVTGTNLEQTLCRWPALGNRWWWDEILFRAVWNCGWLNSNDGSSPRVLCFGKCLWMKCMEGWLQQPSIWIVGMECAGMGDISVAKHFDEPTRFSCDLLNDGPYQITAKNLWTQSSLDDNDEDQDDDQDDDNRPLINNSSKQDHKIDHEGSYSDRTDKHSN